MSKAHCIDWGGAVHPVRAISSIAGNDIEQFKRSGRQEIVSPPTFGSGKFLYPYANLGR